MGSNRVSDEMLARMLASVPPQTLPPRAFGPAAIQWHNPKLPVWAWVQWPNRAAERVEAWAAVRRWALATGRVAQRRQCPQPRLTSC